MLQEKEGGSFALKSRTVLKSGYGGGKLQKVLRDRIVTKDHQIQSIKMDQKQTSSNVEPTNTTQFVTGNRALKE